MQAQRSATPKVIGILMIIFASIGLLLTLVSFGGTEINTSGIDDNSIAESLKSAQTYQTILSVLGLLIGAFHLFTGVASVRYKANAPTLAKTYGIIKIGEVVLSLVISFVIVKPIMDKVPGAGAVFGGLFIVIGLIGLIWPVIVLALMTRPGAKQACTN